MAVRIHHLNCGPGDTGLARNVVFHVLLCETDDGLVLVDLGFSLADADRTIPGLGRMSVARLAMRESRTALRQIEALGYRGEDVKHVVPTHFDFDHIGGLRDFPHATLHALTTEHAAAHARVRPIIDTGRYRPVQFSDHKNVRLYDGTGQPGLGFPVTYPIDGLGEDVLLIPTPGHTLGHAAVAVHGDDGHWTLHAGDAFYAHAAIAAPGEHLTPLERLDAIRWHYTERILAADYESMRANQRRLRDMHADRHSGIRIINAHNRFLYDDAVRSQRQRLL